MQLIAFMALALLALAPVSAQGESVDPVTQAEIFAADAQYRAAMIAIDAAALQAVLTPDFRMVHGDGQISDRAGLLRDFLAWKFQIYERQNPELRMVGSAVMLSAYSVKGSRNRPERAISTELFVRTPDGWRLAFLQNTGLPR